jgi:hypothetical protein
LMTHSPPALFVQFHRTLWFWKTGWDPKQTPTFILVKLLCFAFLVQDINKHRLLQFQFCHFIKKKSFWFVNWCTIRIF